MQRVNKQQAIALKEAGYDVPATARFKDGHESDSVFLPLNWNADKHGYFVSQPTHSEVREWLRVKHGVYVNLEPTLDWSRWFLTIHDQNDKSWSKCGAFPTYEAAESAGTDRALTILKERKDDTSTATNTEG